MVVYCSDRTVNVCGGACTVYNGGATCLSAPKLTEHQLPFCDEQRRVLFQPGMRREL
ncbi:hypothetical protein EV361DRAFT_895097 [Lentinula raphanica]|nr:hypothetical protein EV361DRAFT_895097 [Lentinula raphanica]